jgi:hypothetical protein
MNPNRTARRRPLFFSGLALLLFLVIGAFFVNGCTAPIPRRNPTGDLFPTVTGESLSGRAVKLPTTFAGKTSILLVGYAQNSQFDIDRWLLGLSILKSPAALAEVPTIPGMIPTFFSGYINDGMRRGIPKTDWGGVITTYGVEAERIAKATGNENPLPARVFLLDGEGRIIWFHADGFSASKLRELDSATRKLKSQAAVQKPEKS